LPIILALPGMYNVREKVFTRPFYAPTALLYFSPEIAGARLALKNYVTKAYLFQRR